MGQARGICSVSVSVSQSCINLTPRDRVRARNQLEVSSLLLEGLGPHL